VHSRIDVYRQLNQSITSSWCAASCQVYVCEWQRAKRS